MRFFIYCDQDIDLFMIAQARELWRGPNVKFWTELTISPANMNDREGAIHLIKGKASKKVKKIGRIWYTAANN